MEEKDVALGSRGDGRWMGRRMKRRRGGRPGAVLAVLSAIAALHCGCGAPSRVGRPGRLNVILLSLDTVRADCLGAYGSANRNSPGIDALARRSTVYLDALATSPWTLPSHASMFTGLYPANHGAHCRCGPFTGKIRTLAERLAAEGYETLSFNGGGHVRGALGFARGFARYQSFAFHAGLSDVRQYVRSNPLRPIEEGVAWIKTARGGGRRDRPPFFLFLHSYEVHSPYYSRRDGSFTSLEALKELQLSRDESACAKARRDYEGGLEWADRAVGKLVRALRASGLEDSTILVLTSDHGEAFLEHGFVLHSIKLYREFLQVPLIIFDPRNPAAQVSRKPASIVDIKPTILDLLGMEMEPGMDGVSLLREVDDARRRFAEVCFDPGASNRLLRAGIVTFAEVSSKMIAQKEKRLIFNDQLGTVELYDVASDPNMLANLAGRDGDEAARLKAELDKWIASTRMGYDKPSRRQIRPFERSLPKEQADQLRSLGYIESGN